MPSSIFPTKEGLSVEDNVASKQSDPPPLAKVPSKPAPKKPMSKIARMLARHSTPSKRTGPPQALMTAFFVSSDPGSNQFKYLFEREAHERKLREEAAAKKIREEEERLRRIHQEELQRRAEERKRKRLLEKERKEEERRVRQAAYERSMRGREIVPGLYLGSRLAAMNYEWLSQHAGNVLNVTHSIAHFYENQEAAHAALREEWEEKRAAKKEMRRQEREAERKSRREERKQLKEEQREDEEAQKREEEEIAAAKRAVDEELAEVERQKEIELEQIVQDMDGELSDDEEEENTEDVEGVEDPVVVKGDVVFYQEGDPKSGGGDGGGTSGDSAEKDVDMTAVEEGSSEPKAVRPDDNDRDEEDEDDDDDDDEEEEDEGDEEDDDEHFDITKVDIAQVRYCRIGMSDSIEQDILSHLDEAIAFIDSVLSGIDGTEDDTTTTATAETDGDTAATTSVPAPPQHSVLVHCREGLSRSVSIVLAYLMKARGMSLNDAYELTLAKSFGKLRVNEGFKRQLMTFERTLPHCHPKVNSLNFFKKRSRSSRSESCPASLTSTRASSSMGRRRSSRGTSDANAASSSSSSSLATASSRARRQPTKRGGVKRAV
eukprot:TRINITY_DN1015_c1_g1_i1.p1 TRINITY_DN1015_c1_g1~~TRINITY_DN1015_c1_g1_i1.p1  ORF type:complete len:629 (-),score=216.83 TRINITY_DN1015_c1_g1_i1:3-1814(-)